MGCGLCKVKAPFSTGALRSPESVQQKNDLSPSSTCAASGSPAANTVVQESDKNESGSEDDANTLSPSRSHEAPRTPEEETNRDDIFTQLKGYDEVKTGITSDAETPHKSPYDGQGAREPYETALSSAALTEGKKRVHSGKLSADGDIPKTRQNSPASYVGETLWGRLSLAENDDCYNRRRDSEEDRTQNEKDLGLSGVRCPCSDVSVHDKTRKPFEPSLDIEPRQEQVDNYVDTETPNHRKTSTATTETENTCLNPSEKTVKTDDGDSPEKGHMQCKSTLSKSHWGIITNLHECQKQKSIRYRDTTVSLPSVALAQKHHPSLPQSDRVHVTDRLTSCATPENLDSRELSCSSNKWKDEFPSSKDIEHCIQAAYEACVHYEVDAAEEQLADLLLEAVAVRSPCPPLLLHFLCVGSLAVETLRKAEQLYSRMHALCLGSTGKEGSFSSVSVASSSCAASPFSSREPPVGRSGAEGVPWRSRYDTKHLERKLENLRNTIQTVRQALIFYSGSRKMRTASLRKQQLLHPLRSQHRLQLHAQQHRRQKHQQIGTPPSLHRTVTGNWEEASERNEGGSSVRSSKRRAATRGRGNQRETAS